MLRKGLQRRLSIEALEEKVPLAGDVSVAIVDGDLLITGDTADNWFAIEQPEAFHGFQFRIKGLNQTTINGLGEQWVYFNGHTRDIIMNMGDGNDKIFAYGVNSGSNDQPFAAARDLVVDMGAGDDRLVLGVTEDEDFGGMMAFQSPVHVGRDLAINMGVGEDSVLIASTQVDDDVSISDPAGNTEIVTWPSYLWQYGAVQSSIGDDLSVSLSSGDDYVDVVEFTIGGDVIYSTGGGNDEAYLNEFTTGGSVLVNVGSGNNIVSIGSGTVGGGVLLAGSGANDFRTEFLDVSSSIVLLGSNNDDQVNVNSSNAKSAIIATAGGTDYVQLTDSTFTFLTVSLGAGNDTLSMDNVSSTVAILLGGGGSDTLLESADNNFLLAIDASFETFGVI